MVATGNSSQNIKRLDRETVWFGRCLGVLLVGILSDPSINLSSIGHFVEDAKANGVAHRLARFSLSTGDHCEWIHCPPLLLLISSLRIVCNFESGDSPLLGRVTF
ncbi:hypothetical protein DVH24_036718 [Malus domestica]|uniref:Uncharacterized protein n=1 Tax=Malus domestica TaxID=3750 RepID=A0A498IJW1_MALDO|nr:hypothetical protein DVH24_036718 [Malus domestica]